MLAFKPEQDISDANHAFTNVSITSHLKMNDESPAPEFITDFYSGTYCS